MIKITDPADCCGCTACVSICHHNAITMKPDVLGFLSPEVDIDKCTNCGLCEKVCAFNDHYDISDNFLQPVCYGARHRDINELETSRSGAAFIAISDWFIRNNAVVYGAGYGEHFRVVHKRAISKNERDEFKGSKYVQSDLRGVFKKVEQDLKEGKYVLFSGTPCQTAGLHSFINKKLRENLYLLDIICHGVPSPIIWDDYLTYLEEKYDSPISWVNFRDKQMYGWSAHRETFKFVEGEGKVSFTYLFYKDIMFRKCCSKCHYANTKRPSDITIADFWGWEKTNPEINRDNKGVSLIMCNTEKGKKLFEIVKSDLVYFPAQLEDCIQPNLQRPTPINKKTEQFVKDYQSKGFKYVYYKYGEEGWRCKFSTIINKFLKKIDLLKSKILIA